MDDTLNTRIVFHTFSPTVFIAVCLSIIAHSALIYHYAYLTQKKVTIPSEQPGNKRFRVNIKQPQQPEQNQTIAANPTSPMLEETVVQDLAQTPEVTKLIELVDDNALNPQANKPPTKTLNYSTLTQSIKTTVSEIVTEQQQQFIDTCVNNPFTANDSDCQKHNTESRTELAKFFNRLLASRQQQYSSADRARMLSQQQTLKAILDNPDLAEDVREQIASDLDYLRSEIIFDDCNGDMNKGNCAGEIDINKLIRGLGKVISKIKNG